MGTRSCFAVMSSGVYSLLLLQCYIEDFRLMTESVGMQLDDDSLLALFSKVRKVFAGNEVSGRRCTLMTASACGE
jgi:hypothetical protein